MSSSNVSLILSELSATRADVLALKSEVSALRAALSAKSSAAPAVVSTTGKPVAEKKPRKKSDAPPTAWRLFTDRVRQILKDNGYTAKAIGVECVQFCSTLKAENDKFESWSDADILARRAGWTAPEVSKQKAAGKSWRKPKTGSAPASVVSGGDDDELDGGAAPASTDKPKRKSAWDGLSPEQHAAKVAKMKAGRDAKKAAESAETTSSAAPVEVSVTTAASSSSSSAAASSSSSAAAVVVSAPSSAPVGFKKVALNNERFWVNLESGHAYYRLADESQGEWAGLFSKTPKPNVDKSVPEPTADDDDDDADGFQIDE